MTGQLGQCGVAEYRRRNAKLWARRLNQPLLLCAGRWEGGGLAYIQVGRGWVGGTRYSSG